MSSLSSYVGAKGFLREVLPTKYTYGWKFFIIYRSVQLSAWSFLAYTTYILFLREAPDVGVRAPGQYQIVYDERTGRPVDIAYKPYMDAAMRAKERASKLI